MKKPTPHQTFLVLSMYFGTAEKDREPSFGEGPLKSLKPALRNELVEAQVLRTGKRGRKSFVALGEDAEDFVMANLGAPLPKTPAAGSVLTRVLGRVRELLQTQGCSLAEFAGAKAEQPPVGARSEQLPEQAVREAYLLLTHGEKRRRIRLADLRRKVPVPHEVLNDTLIAMQNAGQIVLYKLDNTAEISADDEQAALYVADQPRHIVYLEA